MDGNQARVHTTDPSLIHTDTLHSDSMGNPFMSDDYLAQDDMDGSDNSDDSGNDIRSKHTPLREQDRFLPIANIAKIMKRAIPDNGKIAKDARECIQECVSEFISFITSEASDRCHQEKRKTINGEDILFAMCALGFDHYIEPLTLYLHKYRETTKSDRNLVNSEVSSNETAFEEPASTDFSQQTTRNGISLGQQSGDTILYYQADQSSAFQL